MGVGFPVVDRGAGEDLPRALLAGLSALATAYVGVATMLFETCR